MKTAYVQNSIQMHGKWMNLHLPYLQYLWNLIKVFFCLASSWDLFYTFFCILSMSRVSENDFAKQWKISECCNFIECSTADTLNPWRGDRPKKKIKKRTGCKEAVHSNTAQQKKKKTTNRTWETLVVCRDIETTLW